MPVRAIYADPKIIHESNALNQTRRWLALGAVLGPAIDEPVTKSANTQPRLC